MQRALGRGTRSERARVLCGHKSGHMSRAYHQRYSQPSTHHLEEARHQEKALHGDYPHPSPGVSSLTLLCTSHGGITMLHRQAHIYSIKTVWLENKGRAPSLCIKTSISTNPIYLRRSIEIMPHKEETITVLRAGHFWLQVRSTEDALTCARHAHTDSLAPIFMTSSVTGNGLDLVRLFYNLLPQRVKW